MTDLEIAEFVADTIRHTIRENLYHYHIEIFKDGRIELLEKNKATQYRLKHDRAIIAEIPKLSMNEYVAIAQIALAVGRRIERFERGAKANATRTPISRKEIAQNAIKKRWSAK